MFDEPSYFAGVTKFLGVLYAGPTITNEGEVMVRKIPVRTGDKVGVEVMMHLGFAIAARQVEVMVETHKRES